MAALATNVVPNTGLRIDDKFVAAAAGGDDCVTGAGVFLVVKNGHTAAQSVTLVTPQTVDADLAVADRTISVPATSGETVIPMPDLYRDPSTGRASLTYSGVTALTVCVCRVAAS